MGIWGSSEQQVLTPEIPEEHPQRRDTILNPEVEYPFTREGDGLIGSKNYLYSNIPMTLNSVSKIQEDDYDGFQLETSQGVYILKISIDQNCCEEITIDSSVLLEPIKDLEIVKWSCNSQDIPEDIIGELLGEVDTNCYYNYIFLVLTPKEGEDIYFVVNNSHNGEYAHDAAFLYTDKKGITKTLIDTYL